MLFSDNVTVEDEVRLKDAAAAADVLVMGPDCGTAVVGGAALGFANAVQPGEVGIVAASGTGAQQVMCLLDAAGVGVSHCLGVGAATCPPAVAGRSTRQALAALAADAATDVRRRRVQAARRRGPRRPRGVCRGAAVAGPLGDARRGSAGPHRGGGGRAPRRRPRGPAVALVDRRPGIGGQRLAARALLRRDPGRRGHAHRGRRRSAAYGPTSRCPRSSPSAPTSATDGHVVIDFGDDGLTQGRAHPMIDPSLRLERIAAEAKDDTCGVLLLDLVLGYGAHRTRPTSSPRPSARPGPRRRGRAGRSRSSCPSPVPSATRRACSRCATALRDAGASVFLSNAEATARRLPPRPAPAAATRGAQRHTAEPCRTPRGAARPPLRRTSGSRPRESRSSRTPFAPQAVPVTEAAGSPDAGHGARPRRPSSPTLGAKRPTPRRCARMTAAGADLVDVRPAREALGSRARHVPARGPAHQFDRASGPLKGALIGAMLFEGSPTPPRRRRPSSRRATASRSSRATTATPWARWRASSAVDVALRAARRGARQHVVVLAQRGPRQGAALRRLRTEVIDRLPG